MEESSTMFYFFQYVSKFSGNYYKISSNSSNVSSKFTLGKSKFIQNCFNVRIFSKFFKIFTLLFYNFSRFFQYFLKIILYSPNSFSQVFPKIDKRILQNFHQNAKFKNFLITAAKFIIIYSKLLWCFSLIFPVLIQNFFREFAKNFFGNFVCKHI